MENYNIDDLIQGLRNIYDSMKVEKSQLNNKIRTLNNAVSRKDRKEKEYNSYQAKAAMTKKSTIDFSKDAYVDITNSSIWINRNLSHYKMEIERLSLNVDILENSGELTKAQKASVNLFKQFSNEVIQYIDNNIYELKNGKYDSLKQFVEVEANLNNDNQIILSQKLQFNTGVTFETMMEMASEWKSLREDRDEEIEKIKQSTKHLRIELNFTEEKSQIFSNLLRDAQNKLDVTNQELDNFINQEQDLTKQMMIAKKAIEALDKTSETYEADYANLVAEMASIEESSEEVRVNIAKLQKAKKELQAKLEELQKENDELKKSISDIQKKIEDLDRKLNENANNYQQLIDSKYAKVYNMYNEYLRNRSTFIGENQDAWYKTFGDLISYELTAYGFRLICDGGCNNNDFWYLVDMSRSKMADRKSSMGNKYNYTPYIQVSNQELADGLFKSNDFASDMFGWRNGYSFILNNNVYDELKKYLSILMEISRIKSSISDLDMIVGEYRGKLDLLYKTKESSNESLLSLDQDLLSINDSIDKLNLLYEELDTRINNLDATDPEYLYNWENLQNEKRELRFEGDDLSKQVKKIENSQSKFINHVFKLNSEITNLEQKIAAVDDEQRQLDVDVRSSEEQAKSIMNDFLNPDGGQLVASMDSEGRLSYYDDYSSAIGDNLFKDEITTSFKSAILNNWDLFTSSSFGHLMELVSGNIQDTERIIDTAKEFIICL